MEKLSYYIIFILLLSCASEGDVKLKSKKMKQYQNILVSWSFDAWSRTRIWKLFALIKSLFDNDYQGCRGPARLKKTL